MPGTERDLVSRLLKQSILALCREAVTYNSQLEIDGIVCVTLDNQIDHVVKIHERFSKPEVSNCTSSDSQSSIRDNVDTSSRHAGPINIPVKVEVKTEPSTSPIEYLEIKQESLDPSYDNGPTRDISPVKPNSRQGSPVLSSSTSVPIKLEPSQARHITCKKCNAVLDDAKTFESHNMSSHGFFTCMVCLSTFTSRNNMKRHLRLHTGIKPYTCGSCKESFARNDDYKRHLLRHSFEKPFRCVLCKSGYSDRSCIKNHMLKEHDSKIFFICPQCGESYIDARQFQLHKKTHPEFQGYRCTLCSFVGSSPLMYNKHMLVHGSPKRYSCGHCELPFNDPFSYTNHMKQHKGDELVYTYKCCFCDHEAPTFEQFQRHEHSHVQSKQHTCEVCDKHFRYPSNLREHMLTHMDKSTLPLIAHGRDNSPIEVKQITPDEASTEMVKEHDVYNQTEDDRMPQLEAEPIEQNIGSDYWCTECNQGFGTEDLLQHHIINTHETNARDLTISPQVTNADENGGNDMDIEMEHDKAHAKFRKLYSINTQADSPTDPIYDEDTQMSTMSRPSIYRKDIYESDTRQHEGGLYKGHAQSELNLPISLNKRKSGGMAAPIGSSVQSNISKHVYKRARVFDEETIIDEDDSYKQDIDNEIDTNSTVTGVGLNSAEMSIVKDAMKQVQDIHSRFGINANMFGKRNKTLSNVNKNTSKLLPSSAYGLMESPLVTSRDSQRSNTLHDINKNNISATFSSSADSVSSSKVASPNAEKMITLESFHIKGGNSENRPNSSSPFQQYSKSSVLGMDTEFSTNPNKGSPTTLNLTHKSPGFEKVVTPTVLFKTRSPFTCELCDETFSEFDPFDKHGISVHRRYICSYCGKPFTSRPNRERHVRYHTGEKPYKCDVCGVSFFRGDDLKYHRTTKHSDIRPFLCGTCKRSFTAPKELERHLRAFPDHRGNEITGDII